MEIEPFQNHKSQKRFVVQIENGVKSYNKLKVLQGINLNIEEGGIYALLGSSGSGKTTLLSAILGISQLDSGSISVFGFLPGSKECGIPGNRLGFQPQETSLSEEFSISESLHFFGKIYGMTLNKIKEQIEFYLKLLDLPHASKTLIKNLSGGEKRRISFAIALFHDPELLILDEPTVGCDALLRVKMWNHLKNLSLKKTVIITTHHVDDCMASNMIGLIRNGHLIVEKSPQQLSIEYNHKSLSNIIVTICQMNEQETIKNIPPSKLINKDLSLQAESKSWEPYSEFISAKDKILALVKRNFIINTRNIWFLSFVLILPSITVFCVKYAIGTDLKNIKFGYVNDEILQYSNCSEVELHDFHCRMSGLSCTVLKGLEENNVIMIGYKNETEAHEAVKAGLIWGYLTFPEDFSNFLIDQYLGKSYVANKTIIKKGVHIQADATSAQVLLSLKNKFFNILEKFTKNLTLNCGNGQANFLEFDEPVFGPHEPNLGLFSIPPLILIMMFSLSMAMSGLVLITEKKTGNYIRILTAGCTKIEILISHLLMNFAINFIQITILLIILIHILNYDIIGSVFLSAVFIFIHCCIGLLFGFAISLMLKDDSNLIQVLSGIILPTLVMSTSVWPIEGMSPKVKLFAKLLPQTLMSDSLRSVMNRGLPLSHSRVYTGVFVSLLWLILLTILLIFLNKSKKKLCSLFNFKK